MYFNMLHAASLIQLIASLTKFATLLSHFNQDKFNNTFIPHSEQSIQPVRKAFPALPAGAALPDAPSARARGAPQRPPRSFS